MADETILVDVQYDTDDAVKEVDDLSRSIEKLIVDQKTLKEQVKDGSVAWDKAATQNAKLTEQIKKEKKERRDTIKVIQAEKNSRDGIKASITKLKTARDKLDTTSKKNRKTIKKLNKDIDDQNKKLKKTKSRTEGLSGALTSIIPGLAGFSSGLQKFGQISKFALGPLGLLIAAIGALIAFFKGSEEGQNRLNKILTVGRTIIGNLADSFRDFGKVVLDSILVLGARFTKFFARIGLGWAKLKNIFTDNSEAIQEQQKKIADAEKVITDRQNERKKSLDELKTGIKGIIDETKREIDIAKDLADRQAALDINTRKNLIREAELRRDVANLRAQAADKENLDAETRLRLLDEAIEKENEILENAQALAKERLALKEIENSLADSTKEDLEEQAQLEAALIALETTNAEKRRRLLSERLTAEREIKAEARARELEAEKIFNEEIAEIEKELAEQRKIELAELDRLRLEAIQRELDAALAAEEDKRLARQLALEGAKQVANQLSDFLVNSNQIRLGKETQALEAQKEKELAIAGNDATKKTAIEKKFEAEKQKLARQTAKKNQKIQIANAVINGAVAITKALSQLGPIAGAISAVLIGITTAFQVATIKQQQFKRGGNVKVAERGAQFGTFSGPSHSMGGIDLYTGSGQHVANVEGKENFYVVNKNASDYINSLSDINQRIGGGVPLSNKSGRMQDGGQADVNGAGIDINEVTEQVVKRLPPIFVRTVDIKTGLEDREETIDVGVI